MNDTLLDVQSRLCRLADGLRLVYAAAVDERDRAGSETGLSGIVWALASATHDLEETRLALDGLSGGGADNSPAAEPMGQIIRDIRTQIERLSGGAAPPSPPQAARPRPHLHIVQTPEEEPCRP